MDSQKALAHLSQAISIPTISNLDESLTDWSQFEKFHAFLEESYPLVHKHLTKEVVEKASLLYRWKGKDSSLKPFAMLGHIDVVPVPEETKNEWKYPPFSGECDEEYIYGRGANDMKNCVVALMEAVENLLEEGFVPERDVYICFGHNEEVLCGEGSGAGAIANLLKSRGVRLEFVYDEGGAIMDDNLFGLKNPAAMVGLAEKGYADLKLSISNNGGHAAEPSDRTALGDLARLISTIERNQMPCRLIRTVVGTLKELGKNSEGVLSVALKALGITKPFVMKILKTYRMTHAMMHTTIVPTICRAGTAVNVLPQKVEAMFNIRLLPGDTIEDVEKHIKRLAKRVGVLDELTLQFVNTSPAPEETSADSETYKIIEKTMKEIDPDIVTIPYLVTGATDSREYKEVADEIYRIYPFKITGDELDSMHGINERLRKSSFIFGIEYFIRFIRTQAERRVN